MPKLKGHFSFRAAGALKLFEGLHSKWKKILKNTGFSMACYAIKKYKNTYSEFWIFSLECVTSFPFFLRGEQWIKIPPFISTYKNSIFVNPYQNKNSKIVWLDIYGALFLLKTTREKCSPIWDLQL